MERKFLDFSLPCSECSTEQKFHGSESSLYGLFAPGNESTEELKGQIPPEMYRVPYTRTNFYTSSTPSFQQLYACRTLYLPLWSILIHFSPSKQASMFITDTDSRDHRPQCMILGLSRDALYWKMKMFWRTRFLPGVAAPDSNDGTDVAYMSRWHPYTLPQINFKQHKLSFPTRCLFNNM